jgi:hypothetical protein
MNLRGYPTISHYEKNKDQIITVGIDWSREKDG